MYPQTIQVIEDKLKLLQQQNNLLKGYLDQSQSEYHKAVIDLNKNEIDINGLEKELALINSSIDNSKNRDGIINQIVAPEAMADVERLQYMLRECDALQDKIKAGFSHE